jgi:pyruvate/2-oxoglutarate dehydrogenase complex dihydrolipoamide dehydrogenase (E3) component
VLLGEPVTVDMKKIKARMDRVVGVSSKGVERSLRGNPKISVLMGQGRFVSPREVAVGGRVLEAPRIFIDVGGRAIVPDIPGLDGVSYVTNSTILDVDFLPPHLIVVGGSYVGLEQAQVYRCFGANVTVLEMAQRLIRARMRMSRQGLLISSRPRGSTFA